MFSVPIHYVNVVVSIDCGPCDKAKYSYDVPSGWKEEPPTKVEKGAGGQDSRWVQVGSKGAVKCFCLTLNRAGEDGAAFDLTEKALTAIAGADAKLQAIIRPFTFVRSFVTVCSQSTRYTIHARGRLAYSHNTYSLDVRLN